MGYLRYPSKYGKDKVIWGGFLVGAIIGKALKLQM